MPPIRYKDIPQIPESVWSRISNALKRFGFRSRNFSSHSGFLTFQEHVQSRFDGSTII